VRFADAVKTLDEQGVTTFIELGPDAVLTAMAAETTDSALIATTRRGHDEARTTVEALTRLHTHGITVDWAAYFGTTPTTLDLPTYPFQHQTYWLADTTLVTGSAADFGQDDTGHALLGAAVELPDSDGVLFTGRLSLSTHPWLADHAVSGTVILPGAALLDIAIHAADHIGRSTVEELTLHAPLVLGDGETVQLRVQVQQQTVAVFSRVESGDDEPWTRHADGVLAPEADKPAFDLSTWPPAEAEPVDVTGLYDQLAASGLEYGPLFQGLRAAWRDGDAVYAEIALPDGTDTTGFALHPALLDAALHSIGLAGNASEAAELPFAWSDVTLHATGAAALRVHAAPTGSGSGHTLLLADPQGAPVATIGSLALRAVAPGTTSPSRERDLYRIEWSPVTTPSGTATPVPGTVLRVGSVTETLGELQAWLAGTGSDDAKLVVVTRGAVAVGTGITDLDQAAVRGLVRAAQAENPDRIVLLDTDTDTDDVDISTVLACGEPELALRDGTYYAARLARTTPTDTTSPWRPDSTVLITGGTGGLGALTARYLVTHHGVRTLHLVSRRGADAPGATELQAELEATGATMTVTACDISDRQAVTALLDGIPDLTAVIHTAGVLNDATITGLTPTHLHSVWAPKADAARHLHELTLDRSLDAFVLFSSAAATFDGTGQGNYAAANAYLDALATHRHTLGLPATSLAWGLWAPETGGMGATLTDTDIERVARGGPKVLGRERGMALFDAALASGEPHLLPVPFDTGALAERARTQGLPAVLSGLVRTPAARRGASAAAGAEAEAAGLKEQLLRLPADERGPAVLEFVRTHAAAVLGHASADAVDAARGFGGLGFDSLAAVEFRNRLTPATGLRLPATLIFDYPTSEALAGYIREQLVPDETGPTALRAVESELAALEARLLAAAGPDGAPAPEDHARIAESLRALASRWSGLLAGSGSGAADPAADDLATADADELFDILDSEFEHLD
ncbi:hypothetical protein VR41_10590, partial [Streptomyces sp. NRRL B-1568]